MQQRWPVWFFHAVKSLSPLPSQCGICRSWPCADVVCPACLQRFAPSHFRCTGCALVLPGLHPQQPRCGRCLRLPPLWHSAHAWVDYAPPWNALITRWKFAAQPAMAGHFARWMLSHPPLQQTIDRADLLLPVPLSTQRMRERGYNQAALLAQQLGQQSPATVRVLLHTLQRQRHTLSQSSSSRHQRLRNLRQAFTVPATQQPWLAGRRVVLVDDVMTTGATLHAATQAVLQAGAAQVEVLCAARTP